MAKRLFKQLKHLVGNNKIKSVRLCAKYAGRWTTGIRFNRSCQNAYTLLLTSSLHITRIMVYAKIAWSFFAGGLILNRIVEAPTPCLQPLLQQPELSLNLAFAL